MLASVFFNMPLRSRSAVQSLAAERKKSIANYFTPLRLFEGKKANKKEPPGWRLFRACAGCTARQVFI